MELPSVFVIMAEYLEGDMVVGVFLNREDAKAKFDTLNHDCTKIVKWDGIKGEPIAEIEKKFYEPKK